MNAGFAISPYTFDSVRQAVFFSLSQTYQAHTFFYLRRKIHLFCHLAFWYMIVHKKQILSVIKVHLRQYQYVPSVISQIVKQKNMLELVATNFISLKLLLLLLLLLLLSRFSCVQLCATPQTAFHQAPPSLGFSRQEQWSGLPFPSLLGEHKRSFFQENDIYTGY